MCRSYVVYQSVCSSVYCFDGVGRECSASNWLYSDNISNSGIGVLSAYYTVYRYFLHVVLVEDVFISRPHETSASGMGIVSKVF